MKHNPAPASPKRKPSVPPPPKTLPYAPTHRITPPSSVLEPLTRADIEIFNNLRGSHKLAKKRKRIDIEVDDEGDGDNRQRKRSKDVSLIAGHYNARPDVGAKQRLQSPIIGLKAFNNWIKAVLIGKFAHPALRDSPWSNGGKVLDLGCGKGGDLTKWAKAAVAEYIGLDIAAVSIEQARSRHAQMHNASRFPAFFAALDCYTHPISTVVPAEILSPPPRRPQDRPNDGPDVFDVVSMQFCMHYAFESETKARTMLDNVSRYLRRGGMFIGTIPNADLMLQRLLSLPPDAAPRFGNSVYTIEFDDRRPKDQRPVFGDRYSFFLTDAVEDVPEYVVVWEPFVRLAKEYNLHPVYRKEFHEVFQENQEDKEFGPLMVRMKVVDQNGESHMNEDQWEAANIYIAFAFEKR
ncbi:guanine-N(7)-methyltransferase [Heliocybe sulcata]|uniref:mRNA cap guanine-N(7) methyltransferase n=1 Tax=Heliocybe sulcata TaxID=5364 RepID=A0A5C3ND89_9AGAM|nr:guanine-N(7)-methyltransferase [Heliocybe sulcata]